MEIKQQKIDATFKALNEINILIMNGVYNTNKANEIFDRHSVNRALITHGISCKIFERTGRGTYKSNIKQIDPIHARNCIIESRKRDAKNHKVARKIKDKIEKTLVQPVYHPKVEKKDVPMIKSKPKKYKSATKDNQPQKTISIFWGLFKYTK